jgi:uncharacterized protein YihD (DUF1040 family)
VINNLNEVVAQFKQLWTRQLDDQAITEVCREAGMSWRQTVLTPIVTIKVFFLQILHGNSACAGLRHLARLAFSGAAFRIHQRQIVDFTPERPHVVLGGSNRGKKSLPRSRWIKTFALQDHLVEWFKPLAGPKWMSAEQFASLTGSLRLRELRYRVECNGFRPEEITLVTTLLDAELYPAEELASPYQRRWTIETSLRHLQITMKMNVLKCMTVDGVLKELAVFVLIYNLVRLVMVEASRLEEVAVERISFIDALRWLVNARPGDRLCHLVVNPQRPNRYEPRVKKRRPKAYPLMTQPPKELKKELAA